MSESSRSASRVAILPTAGISTGSACRGPETLDIQFKIFSDYGSHIARFPTIQAYHSEHQPPCLLLWGRHDPFFDINEIMAYNRILDSLEIHVFESGHQLLETHHRECAALASRFMLDVEAGRV
ncbi:alpha/beta fold hydrolase [Allomesorhizobium camelthorni]|uniref:alpha/beta fold hydrolase n=1 Tax=Allomesorhizobium camelthorni TaxID=475069 RepID=UPI001FE321C3|nr:hypothetical protein [Mesorhizobium camelthorni]